MQREFEVKLLFAESAGAEGVFFVYEFDGDDGTGCISWYGFADAGNEKLRLGRVLIDILLLPSRTMRMRRNLWSWIRGGKGGRWVEGLLVTVEVS